MRLVIFGLTVSSSWGNGHATIWRGLCRALARKGHQVRFFERDVPYYAAHRDLQNSEPYQLILYSAWEEVEAQAREAVAAADSAIVTSYCPDALAAADLILDSPPLLRTGTFRSGLELRRRAGAGRVTAVSGSTSRCCVVR